MNMAPEPPPIDAKTAKRTLRFYAVTLPITTLIGGWCSLLAFAWVAFPASVANIPVAVKSAASAIAVLWILWLCRTFQKLPAVIDAILERGLIFSLDRRKDANQWFRPSGRGE